MSIFSRKACWYQSGLAFECTKCGRCCSGPEEGYVWLTENEMNDIAGFLKIVPEEMRKKYVRKVSGRLTIIERSDNHDCIFLAPDGKGGKGCSIYSVRPTQCRTWPFWPANLQSIDHWAMAGLRCPGVNRGKVFSFEEIEARRKETGK